MRYCTSHGVMRMVALANCGAFREGAMGRVTMTNKGLGRRREGQWTKVAERAPCWIPATCPRQGRGGAVCGGWWRGRTRRRTMPTRRGISTCQVCVCVCVVFFCVFAFGVLFLCRVCSHGLSCVHVGGGSSSGGVGVGVGLGVVDVGVGFGVVDVVSGSSLWHP